MKMNKSLLDRLREQFPHLDKPTTNLVFIDRNGYYGHKHEEYEATGKFEVLPPSSHEAGSSSRVVRQSETRAWIEVKNKVPLGQPHMVRLDHMTPAHPDAEELARAVRAALILVTTRGG